MRPTIVVGIDNTAARWREYAPAAALAALSPELSVAASAHDPDDNQSEQYLRFLIEELKPFVDAHYRTRPGREATYLMGSSMGGLIWLYALTRYAEIYGGAGCLSTHWPLTTNRELLDRGPGPQLEAIGGAYLDWLARHLPHAGTHRIYFDHGTVGLDALYAPFQARMDGLMAAAGYQRGGDWESLTFEGAAHDEAAWRARLDTPLRFLLRR